MKEDAKKFFIELSDDQLGAVTGGAFGDLITCPVCGKPKREGYLCTRCEMADGIVTCHRCRGKLSKDGGCANCGMTWDAYVQITREIISSYPSVKQVKLAHGASVAADSLYAHPCLTAIIRCDTPMDEEQTTKLNNWLKIRLNTEELALIVTLTE